jgi:acyl dehydratase
VTSTSVDLGISDTPVEGVITDEGIAEAREMIGTILRPEGPYLQDATGDTLRNWCNGIGDLNPLYREAEYGRSTRYGSQIAHPGFPLVYGWVGRTRWGLTGVHGFGAGNDWEIYRNIRPGDRLSATERVVAVEERPSRFSGRVVFQYVEGIYTNQRDEVVAKVVGWCARHERRAARDTGKHREQGTYVYTPRELQRIESAVLGERERIRGADLRYWEDVVEGQELDPIARGPLSAMDTIGFLVGSGRGHTHGVLLEAAKKHPAHYFRNPESGGGIEYTGIGHHRETTARNVGVPGAYDYGPQRHAWMITLVANWMGDNAFLKRIRTEWRRFNVAGDTTWCKGKVARKYVKDGYALVDLEIWGENQRGEITTPGQATVILPSRNIDRKLVTDGSGLELRAGE